MRVPTKKCVQLQKSLSLGPASPPALCCGAELLLPSASAGVRGARQAPSAGTLPDPTNTADFGRAAALADVSVLGLAPMGSGAALPGAAAPCPFRPRVPSGLVLLQRSLRGCSSAARTWPAAGTSPWVCRAPRHPVCLPHTSYLQT